MLLLAAFPACPLLPRVGRLCLSADTTFRKRNNPARLAFLTPVCGVLSCLVVLRPCWSANALRNQCCWSARVAVLLPPCSLRSCDPAVRAEYTYRPPPPLSTLLPTDSLTLTRMLPACPIIASNPDRLLLYPPCNTIDSGAILGLPATCANPHTIPAVHPDSDRLPYTLSASSP